MFKKKNYIEIHSASGAVLKAPLKTAEDYKRIQVFIETENEILFKGIMIQTEVKQLAQAKQQPTSIKQTPKKPTHKTNGKPASKDISDEAISFLEGAVSV